MAANEDVTTRICKANGFVSLAVIGKAIRFLCFGICMYGWQSCLYVSFDTEIVKTGRHERDPKF